ncbi:hypothetical protein [Xanthomonas arboricola]|uniref:hypothetical protein n=1 Tax=Xanthomonas arboricola TaxID=56448 RepID=UPI0011B076A0|nr:hypothetical protein [Xanthomonas arboricola]
MKKAAVVVALVIAMNASPVLAAQNASGTPSKSFVQNIVDLVLQNDTRDLQYSRPSAPDMSSNDFKPPSDKGGGGVPGTGGRCYTVGSGAVICQAM